MGYSPERYSGPAFTNYHLGGNDFNYPQNLKSRADDYRFGADARVAGFDLSFMQGFRRFRDDSFVNLGPTQGINPASTAFDFGSFTHNEPTRGSIDFTRFSAHTLIAKQLDITGRVVYSKSDTNFTRAENFTGTNFNPRVTGGLLLRLTQHRIQLNVGQYNITGDSDDPIGLEISVSLGWSPDKFRISNTFRVEDFNITGNAVFADLFTITRPTGATTRTDTFSISNLDAHRTTEYRKYQNTWKVIISLTLVTVYILAIDTHIDVFSKVSRDSSLVQMVQSHLQRVHQLQRKTRTTLMHSLVASRLGHYLIGRFTSTLNTELQITYLHASATTITQTSAPRVVMYQGKMSHLMSR